MARDEHWEGYEQAVRELSTMLQRDPPMLAIFQGGPAMAYEANFLSEVVAIMLTRARGKGQAYEDRVKPAEKMCFYKGCTALAKQSSDYCTTHHAEIRDALAQPTKDP